MPPAPLGFFKVADNVDVISADHMNSAIMQGIPFFASAAARDSAWPTPHKGARCYVTGVGWQRNTTGTPAGWVTEVADGATQGTVLNGAGSRIIRGGQTVVTTSASGVFTLPHGLGAVPTWAVMLCADRASAGSSWAAAAHQANWDATNLEAAAFYILTSGGMTAGTSVASKSIRVAWVAGLA